ncbi:DnaJ like protein 1 [Nosema granulosis]|uniref:DnaJ like protein 1 n=1 Tax=Nosema granulosis TaxID=83296 RepID=A0A9P6KZ99_9MICR|nr:DnaJ like protein 1 [Nosema granulosis]
MSLYKTLNVDRNATLQEIEKSYKRLMLDVHPNRNKNAVERYLEINSAYDILKDKYKRDFYDNYGENSLTLLRNDKDGFVLSRCFTKSNVLTCAILGLISIFNIMLLPLYIYFYHDSEHVSYTIYIFPFFISSLLFLLPVYRAYILINKLVFQLFNLLCASINVVYLGLESFLICLYADSALNYLVVGCLLTILEVSSIFFIYYRTKKIEEYSGDINATEHLKYKKPAAICESLKKHISQALWSLSVILTVIPHIPVYVRAPLPFAAIVFYISNTNFSPHVKRVWCTPIVIYSITFCFVVSGFRNLCVFIPLSLLFISVFIVFSFIYRSLPYHEPIQKELEHDENRNLDHIKV